MNQEILNEYLPWLTPAQIDLLARLETLYQQINESVNLISRKDIANVFVHHILHSLSIARVIQFIPGTVVLDVGTGGGLPGIPLAIAFPEARFQLADSIAKKIKAVDNMVASLALHNVETYCGRVEKIHGLYDFAVSRAVAPLRDLYAWTSEKIKQPSLNPLTNGLLCLKGGELDKEMQQLKRPSRVFELHTYFPETFFLAKKLIHVPV